MIDSLKSFISEAMQRKCLLKSYMEALVDVFIAIDKTVS